MSQVPAIVPLVVSGAFLGRVWSEKELKTVRKKAILAAAISGVLNAVHGLLLQFLRSAQVSLATSEASSSVRFGAGAAQANNPVSFVVACGLTGFVAVLAVYFSALGIIWSVRRKQVESESESEE